VSIPHRVLGWMLRMPSRCGFGIFKLFFSLGYFFSLELQVRDVIGAAIFQRSAMIHDVVEVLRPRNSHSTTDFLILGS
jgi:hypothetical protein